LSVPLHQAPPGIGKANGLARFDKHPSARGREHDGLNSHPINRRQYVPLLRLTARRLVQYADEVKG
jgi:hypothetical protein